MSDDLLPPGTFAIDLSEAPYEVPCPECLAFALEACRTERKVVTEEPPSILSPGWRPGMGRLSWPITSRKIPLPHQARWDHWHDHPEYRVKAIR